jgi:hypothetical protein
VRIGALFGWSANRTIAGPGENQEGSDPGVFVRNGPPQETRSWRSPGASDTWEAMKAAERAKRDAQIYLASVRGFPYTVIGRSHGLSARQVRRIVEEQRKGMPSPLERSAAEHIEDLLEMCEVAISDLAQMAMEAPTDRAKVAAINAKFQVMQKSVRLMQRLGVLPTPDRLSQASLAELGQMIRGVALQHGASPAFQDSILTAISDWGEAHGVAPIWASANQSDISSRENVRSRKSSAVAGGDRQGDN